MPFSNAWKKYWIIPQESLRPEDLELGSILKRPDDPIDLLNRHAVEPIDPKLVVQEREQVSKSFSDAMSRGAGLDVEASSALAAVLGGAPTLGAARSTAASETIEATRVRARHFSPSDEYAARALLTRQIASYVGQSFFTAPVFMVVGVAVASKLVRAATVSRDAGLRGGAAVGPPGSGVELSAAVYAGRATGSTYEDSVDGDVVLAYRLRRFRYSRMRSRFVKDKQDGVFHRVGEHGGESAADSDDEGEDGYLPVFSYFEDNDVWRVAGTQGFAEVGQEESESESESESS
ncbi:uncharacterized protein UV8b_00542 [Ustilaginoidea virens]|uniref:Uncharacterized protein n=1 Tax=Ustilaginoidea virens TaxID=1159556 RepID=A0A063BTQ6_USTVR|nr:uncharacterized protein UV8b_00542 [Ustilaginoidea virens]QUC16301.1 hypothetical protein UV8b_00542 [Ustilaginoidea virens]GAO19177.1 hypothetical protein UVI_02014630 [Ustilaginoidea virens]